MSTVRSMNELYILSRQNSRSNRANFSWFSCCLFLDQSPRNKRWQIPIRSYLVHHSGTNLGFFSCLWELFPSFFCRWELSDAKQALKLPSFYCVLWSLVSGQLLWFFFFFIIPFSGMLAPSNISTPSSVLSSWSLASPLWIPFVSSVIYARSITFLIFATSVTVACF